MISTIVCQEKLKTYLVMDVRRKGRTKRGRYEERPDVPVAQVLCTMIVILCAARVARWEPEVEKRTVLQDRVRATEIKEGLTLQPIEYAPSRCAGLVRRERGEARSCRTTWHWRVDIPRDSESLGCKSRHGVLICKGDQWREAVDLPSTAGWQGGWC